MRARWPRQLTAIAAPTATAVVLLSILAVTAPPPSAAITSAGQQQTALPGDDPRLAGTFTVAAVHSGKCIQPWPGKETLEGEWLVQMPCNGSAAQRHLIRPLGNNRYQLVTESGYCWNVKGGIVHLYNPILQWRCGPYSNDQFVFNPVEPDGFEILTRDGVQHVCNEMYCGLMRIGLHVFGAGTEDRTRLVLDERYGPEQQSTNNLFRFTRVS
ncbi:RICIN domain-containing protein [Nonomuraea longicatena]|uniref:Ricin B lectin domain-containing protein n=1 Tax=Nonomuraea longicatena TaxID=83682 RepID=A0ABP4A3A1_9ACTN